MIKMGAGLLGLLLGTWHIAMAADLSDNEAKKCIEADFNSSFLPIRLGRFNVLNPDRSRLFELSSDKLPEGTITARYWTFTLDAFEKVGLITVEADPSFEAGLDTLVTGIGNIITVQKTSKGEELERANKLPQKSGWLFVPYGRFVVTQIVKNEPRQSGVEDCRLVMATYDAAWVPEYIEFSRLSGGSVVSEKRKCRMLLRHDPFQSKWEAVSGDFENLDAEFTTDNISAYERGDRSHLNFAKYTKQLLSSPDTESSAAVSEVIPEKPTRHLNDYAGVVKRMADYQSWETGLDDLERKTSCEVLVVIYPKMQSNSSAQDYTARVAQAWGVGKTEKGHGVVLFVFVEDRQAVLQLDHRLGRWQLGMVEAIMKDIESSLKKRDFEQCLDVVFINSLGYLRNWDKIGPKMGTSWGGLFATQIGVMEGYTLGDDGGGIRGGCFGQFGHGTRCTAYYDVDESTKKIRLVDIQLAGRDTEKKYNSTKLLVHAGNDISAPEGSDVFSIADGTVSDLVLSTRDKDFSSLGYMVIVEHTLKTAGKPTFSMYLHLKEKPSVELGQKVVARKTRLGYVGSSGAAFGPHLHLEVRHFPARFNPRWKNIYGIESPKEQATFDEKEFKENWSSLDSTFVGETAAIRYGWVTTF